MGSQMTKARQKVKVLNSKMVFKGKVFGVRRDEVIEPGAVRARREVIAHPGSVVILPVFADKRILMIRQYRTPPGNTYGNWWRDASTRRNRQGSGGARTQGRNGLSGARIQGVSEISSQLPGFPGRADAFFVGQRD